jgi:hypothetical protein
MKLHAILPFKKGSRSSVQEACHSAEEWEALVFMTRMFLAQAVVRHDL